MEEGIVRGAARVLAVSLVGRAVGEVCRGVAFAAAALTLLWTVVGCGSYHFDDGRWDARGSVRIMMLEKLREMDVSTY